MAGDAKGRGTSVVALEAKVGTQLRGRCLDGCYGNLRHSETLCISHTDRRSVEKKQKHKQQQNGIGECGSDVNTLHERTASVGVSMATELGKSPEKGTRLRRAEAALQYIN